MTLPKTLERAITKALKTTYVPIPGYKVHSYKAEVNKAGFGHVAFMLYQDIPGKDERKFSQVTLSIADVLFDHGFLKAVYGDKDWCSHCGTSHLDNSDCDCGAYKDTKEYKWHGIQLALLETNKGRINYIGSTM